jgi:hypothetical protein
LPVFSLNQAQNAVACACVANVGCGGEKRPEGFPEVAECSIKILQEGAPLEGAKVNLVAQDPALMRWGCGGVTNADGVVELRTNGYPGAPVGSFKVVVLKTETVGGAQTKEDYQRQMQGENLGPEETFDLVDRQYADQTQTPLTLEVKAGKNETQEFDVGAPIREPIRMPGS